MTMQESFANWIQDLNAAPSERPHNVWRNTRLPLGIHGAILPFIMAPAGFLLGRGLCFLHTTHYGFTYFGLVQIHYAFLAIVFPPR